MTWRYHASGNAGAVGHNKVLRMKAKRNRYDLSLWDLRKLSLYGRARRMVQNGSQFVSFGRLGITSCVCLTRVDPITDHELPVTDFLYFHQDGIKRGRVAHVGKFF